MLMARLFREGYVVDGVTVYRDGADVPVAELEGCGDGMDRLGRPSGTLPAVSILIRLCIGQWS